MISSSTARPDRPAAHARSGPVVGRASVGDGTYGGLLTITSKRWPPIGSNRWPQRTCTVAPALDALSNTFSSACAERSTAVTRPPASAAATATIPLPVHRSKTSAPGTAGSAATTSASSQESERGANTSGRVMISIDELLPRGGHLKQRAAVRQGRNE